MRMAHVAVTSQAGQLGTRARMSVYCLNYIRVAMAARVFGDCPVSRGHLDGFMKPAGGKGQRMIESIDGLGCIFAYKIVGSVTIVAHRHGMMRRLGPPIELRVHNVTVGTRLGIVRQIGCALSKNESESAQADCTAEPDGQNYHRRSKPCASLARCVTARHPKAAKFKVI